MSTDRKPIPTMHGAWVALLVALAAACSCNDRPIADAGTTEDEMAAEARRLCDKLVQWQVGCLATNGLPDDLTIDERHAFCMDAFFPEDLRYQCFDEGVLGITCEFSDNSCENFPYTNDSVPVCDDAKLPFSVCRSNPTTWNEHGCDASKCPGECCVHAND